MRRFLQRSFILPYFAEFSNKNLATRPLDKPSSFFESDNSKFVLISLKVQPDYSYDNAPRFDILLVPGGLGSRTEMYNKTTIQWVKSRMDEVKIMASVCTGALILAEAGLLDGKTVTTHWNSYDRLEKDYPNQSLDNLSESSYRLMRRHVKKQKK
ncbi:hypothetical protein FLT15_01130 [Paenibacillus thiaminolyticus]|nr:hypothetical protein [Paenibacillus thiaminolyticus]